jgi:uncharacterized protein YbaR (Trm112 family)
MTAAPAAPEGLAAERLAAETAPQSAANIDRRMLEALTCPQTQGPLRYDAVRQEMISDSAHLAFPIRDGIPILLVSAARAV